MNEVHEHPLFNGQYHEAIWAQMWVSGDTSSLAPDGTPITCAICGRHYIYPLTNGSEKGS